MPRILSSYQGLIKNIGNILTRGRQRAYVAVDNVLVETYWHVGREVVDTSNKGMSGQSMALNCFRLIEGFEATAW